jgi:hypothetical protein
MTCFELESHMEVTGVEGPPWGGTDSESESATPLERRIWEDVVSTASCVEVLVIAEGPYGTKGMIR